MNNPQFHKRKQYIIDKGFQWRFIKRMIFTVVVSILFSQAFTIGFLKIKELINPSSQDVIYFSNTLTQDIQFTKIIEVIWLPLLISALIGSLVILIFGIYYSHKMAGPLFNLKRKLSEIDQNIVTTRMKIRKTDEFHDIENAFNQMLGSLNNFLEDIYKRTEKLNDPKKQEILELIQTLKNNQPQN